MLCLELKYAQEEPGIRLVLEVYEHLFFEMVAQIWEDLFLQKGQFDI
jgi:hypothetical protein